MPKYNDLTPEEERIILGKETERPFSGVYNENFDEGIYLCKRCNSPLFHSATKFRSSCGWPSFDQSIKGAIKKLPDHDRIRTEIVCANCGAHLGHIFTGENLTPKNIRLCVNSTSLRFIPKEESEK